MRPLRIEIAGFTAFRERQREVDLEELGLFVITGPTGSGKTSLLDAMIFALFGRVPRTGKRGVGELVTHGVAEARVKFEFSVDGARYRLARRLPRSGAQSATLERDDGDGWRSEVEGGGVRMVDKRVVELVKLPFEAFCKAVVLPQGQFQEFLRGDHGERRKTLVDLLELKQYEAMGERARGRARDLETRIAQTKEILDDEYDEVSEESLAALTRLATDAEARAVALAEELARAERLDERRRTLAVALESLDRRAEELRTLSADLEAERAGCVEAQDQERKLAGEHQMAQSKVDEEENAVAIAQTALLELIERFGSLERLATVEAACTALSSCAEERASLEERRHAAEKTLEARAGEAKRAAATAAQVARQLEAAEREEAKARAASEEAVGLAEGHEHRRKAAEEAIAERVSAEEELTTSTTALATAEAAEREASDEMKNAEAHRDELVRRHSVAEIAAGVSPGDPCPVCQRPLEAHPQIGAAEAEGLEAARAELKSARQRREDEAQAVATAREVKKSAETRLRHAEAALADALGDAASFEDLVTAAVEAHSAQAAAAGLLKAASKALAEARGEDTEARTVHVEAEALRSGAEEQLSLRTEALTGADRRASEASEVLRDYFGEPLPDDAAARLAEDRARIVAATNARDQAATRRDEAREARDRSRDALETLRENLREIDVKLAGLRARVEAAATRLDVEVDGGSDGVQPAPPPQPTTHRDAHVVALVDWCDTAERQVVVAAGAGRTTTAEIEVELRQLATAHGLGATEDGSAVSALRSAAATAEEERTTRQVEAAALARRLEERGRLETRIAEEQVESSVLKALGAELRGDRFVAFIVQETLDLLAVRASEELRRISSDRYSLVSHDGDFSVVDHANADERRSVNTLSGGETFLASLALALALSQHVGDLATEGMGAKLEAVFIDEGFAALDPDTLEEVIDALERLREGDLMVGVITHVPALAQRIGVGLRVEKDEGRSTVRAAA